MSIEKEVRIRSWGEIITQPKFMVMYTNDLQIYDDDDDDDDDSDDDYNDDSGYQSL